MMDEEKIARLSGIWLHLGDRQPSEAEAEAFLCMYREMQGIDREEAEEARVEHARSMTQRPRRA